MNADEYNKQTDYKDVRHLVLGCMTNEERLVERIGEFFDLRPSDARQAFDALREYVREMSQ